MSFFVSSSSSGNGSGFVFGSYSGSGGGGFSSGFASYSISKPAPSRTTYHHEQSTQVLILSGILIFLAFPVCSVILLMIGNAILRDSGNHHFANHDIAAAAAIGGIFLYVICIIVCVLLLDTLVRRYRITAEAPPPGDFIIFLIALFGAPLCGVLGIAPLLAKRDKFQSIDLLYATEAGFIGAAVLVGGWYTLLFGLMLLFNPSSAGLVVAQLLHLYRFRLRFERRRSGRSSEPEATVPAVDSETAPPAYEQRSPPGAKSQKPENPGQN